VQSRGADPTIRTEDFDPYLNPGLKVPIELAIEEDDTRSKLKTLESKYASVPKVRQPAANIGCWWTVYDHGLEAVKAWPTDDKRQFPGGCLHVTPVLQTTEPIAEWLCLFLFLDSEE
jgi:[acyl-carrier-protein] S-malonyltransferase